MKYGFFVCLLFIYLQAAAMDSPRLQVSTSELDVIKTAAVCCMNIVRLTQNHALKCQSSINYCKRCSDKINQSSCLYVCSCFQDKADDQN